MSLVPYGGPTVLVADVDSDYFDFANIVPGVQLMVVGYEDGRLIMKVVSDAGEPSDRVEAITGDICAGIAFSNRGFEMLTLIAEGRGRVGRGIDSSTFDIVRASPDSQGAQIISSSIQGGLMRILRDMAQRNTDLVRAIAAIRREHEVLQEAFTSLEEVLRTANLPERPAVTLPPTQRCLSPGRNWAMADLIYQRLPVSSRAVSAVDLCFLVTDEESSGNFDVALRSLEASDEIGRWRIPFTQITSGWNLLQLHQGIMGPPRTMELEVKVNIEKGVAPDLVLAGPSALEDAVYRTSSGVKGDAPISLRVWRSLPGLRAMPVVGAFQTHGSVSPSPIQRLSPEILASAQPIGDVNVDPAQPLVQYIEEQGELQVHPRPNGVVAAYVRGAIPPFTTRVTASVITRHAQADVLDYAMVAVQGRVSLEEALARVSRSRAPSDGFSGWNAIAPMDPSQISMSFERPPRTSLDLVLMSRPHDVMTQAQTPWHRIWAGALGGRGHTRFAWARFSDVQIELANH